MNHDYTVTLPYPKFVRAKQAETYFGVKRDQLVKWVSEGKVIAHTAEKAVFYDFGTILRTIESLPVKAAREGV